MSDETLRKALEIAPARTGGYRRLTFDNGRHEDYQAVFVQHSAEEWDRILIARDDGTIAALLVDLINRAALTAPAPTVDAAALREAVEALRWPDSLAAADQPMRGWNGAIDKVLALPALRASAPPHRETSDAS